MRPAICLLLLLLPVVACAQADASTGGRAGKSDAPPVEDPAATAADAVRDPYLDLAPTGKPLLGDVRGVVEILADDEQDRTTTPPQLKQAGTTALPPSKQADATPPPAPDDTDDA